MKHLSILSNETFNLEGALFAPDVLQDLKDGKLDSVSDFKYTIPVGTVLGDEYGRAFHIAVAAWKTFVVQAESQPQVAVRNFARTLFRDALGYTLVPTEADDLRFRLAGKASVPIFFTFADETLDTAQKRFSGEGLSSRRRSLSQFAQEYLNLKDEYLWAIVTNGKTLRLLRDNNALSRPCYAEFDLERILSEERYADFAFFWRLLYRDRAGTTADAKDSVWEKLRDRGAEQGVRVFNDLRDGVVASLVLMGNGFLKNPANAALRSALENGELTAEGFFAELLHVAYRFLFLFAAEERNALHADPPDATREGAERARRLYWEGYSLQRLADRARRAGTDRHRDLWDGIRIVFKCCATGEPRLAIPALGGIFRETETPHLGAATLENSVGLAVMEQLRWTHANGVRFRVDYRNMGAEELGSVYESLLELVPVVTLSERHFGFVGIETPDTPAGAAVVGAAAPSGPRRTARAAGNERKMTGSYYTPGCLVDQQVKSVVDPLISQRLAGKTDPAAQEAALLSLALLDPACGSGHFLLAGARRIAERLAQIRAGGDDVVTPAAYKLALRDVVEHCLYGVDLNPMALELAKIALWIETIVPGRPLTFLDAHFVCGNSILGISRLDQLEHGIPQEAFECVEGDKESVCSALATQNATALRDLQRSPMSASLFATPESTLVEQRRKLEAMPAVSLADVEAKEVAWKNFHDQVLADKWWRAADFYTAAFLEPKDDANRVYPSTATLAGYLTGDSTRPHPSADDLERSRAVCRDAHVLHWPMAFPLVFSRGGFDCILANPPWDSIELKKEEYFATRLPDVSESALDAVVARLKNGIPAEQKLYADYLREEANLRRVNSFVSAGKKAEKLTRYPLTGDGADNLYALFAELIVQLLAPNGRAGIIVPTGICTDDSTKGYFQYLVEKHMLESIYDFENRRPLFPSVHRMYKFSLLSIGEAADIDCAFYMQHTDEIEDDRRHFKLSKDDLGLINPNTRTAPICRTAYDAALTKKLYERFGVFILDAQGTRPGKNPWCDQKKPLKQGLFNMSTSRRLFCTSAAEGLLPLYEGKLIEQFDHRFKKFVPGNRGPTDVEVELEDKRNIDYEMVPRYWIDQRHVYAKVADVPDALRKAYVARDFTAQCRALANWCVASLSSIAVTHEDILVRAIGRSFYDALPNGWYVRRFKTEDVDPLKESELQSEIDEAFFDNLFAARSPKWFIGYRGIARAVDSRTVIASVIPLAGVGHSMSLVNLRAMPDLQACFLGDENSLVHDWIARQKLAGINLTSHYKKQMINLPPTAYTPTDIAYIVPRVLELTYTSHALKPWAEALGHEGEPFVYDEARRAVLKGELDAYYAKLYGLTEEEFRYILDPADVKGPDFPSESFRTLRDDEMKTYGEYRTKRLALEAWARLGD